MKDGNLGCCNLILWDMFFVFGCFAFSSIPIHIVFRVTLGVVAAILFFILLNIPIIGIIIQFLCCVVWYAIFYDGLPLEEWSNGDVAALWFMRIILGVIVFGLHLASFASLVPMDTFDIPERIKFKRRRYDDYIYEFHFNEEADPFDYDSHFYDKEENKQHSKEPGEDDVSHPFYGCKNLESLKSRYRKLSKTYHPDEASGNAAAFEYIQNEYQRLLLKYK